MQRDELEARIANRIAPWEFPEGAGSTLRIAGDILRARDEVLAGTGERTIDRERLERFLVGMAQEARPVRAAVYEGLLERLRRGDFDEEQGQ